MKKEMKKERKEIGRNEKEEGRTFGKSDPLSLPLLFSLPLSPCPPLQLSPSLISHLTCPGGSISGDLWRKTEWLVPQTSGETRWAVSKPYKHIILTIIIYHIKLFTWGHEHEEKRHNRHRKSRHGNTTRLSSFLLGYRSPDDDDD